jgi:hypothetical protein
MNKKDGLFRPSALLFMHQIIARKLLSSRACYPSFGESKIYQLLGKKPTIFDHITNFFNQSSTSYFSDTLIRSLSGLPTCFLLSDMVLF